MTLGLTGGSSYCLSIWVLNILDPGSERTEKYSRPLSSFFALLVAIFSGLSWRNKFII